MFLHLKCGSCYEGPAPETRNRKVCFFLFWTTHAKIKGKEGRKENCNGLEICALMNHAEGSLLYEPHYQAKIVSGRAACATS